MGRQSSEPSTFQHVLCVLMFTWSLAVQLERSNAFVSMPSQLSSNHDYSSSLSRATFIIQKLRAGGNNNNENTDDDNDSAGAAMNPINNGALVSTLAKLDQQWKIQQASPRAPKSRWSKLFLDTDNDDDDDNDESDDKKQTKNDPFTASDPFATPSTSAVPSQESLSSFVYVLEPKLSSIPSCIVTFVGGAGLGQFPHIAYREMLERLSDQLGGGAVIIAAPYSVGLDHFALAKQTGEALRKGVFKYQTERNPDISRSVPIYSLSHSLGCKLTTIYLAATQQQHNDFKYQGIGFIAYNNFSFSRTIGMARDFAQRLSKSSTSMSSTTTNLFNQLFTFAETAVDFMGLEFSPSPNDMKRLISMKYNANDDDSAWKTRLFCFDDDTLDTTPEFVSAVLDNNNGDNDKIDVSSSSSSVQVSYLSGNHLTPVYLQVRVQDYMSELPSEAQTVASEAMNGFQGISFGNEDDVNALVQEVKNWIYGKDPSTRRKSREEKEEIMIPLITGRLGTDEK